MREFKTDECKAVYEKIERERSEREKQREEREKAISAPHIDEFDMILIDFDLYTMF